MRSIRSTHHGLHAHPHPHPIMIGPCIQADFAASLERSRLPAKPSPSSFCMRSPPQQFFFPTLVPSSFSSPLSSHMRLLQLLLPQSAGPQLLLLSELGSFLVRYYVFSFSSRHRAATPGAPSAEAPSIALIRTSKCCFTSSRHNTSAAHETPESRSGKRTNKRGGQPAPVFTVFTPRVVSTAVARYNFAARDMRELSLREGDVVRIYSKIGGDQGWWKGEANGRVSSLPSRSLSGPLCWFSPRQFKNLFLCRSSVMSQPSSRKRPPGRLQ